MGCLPPTPLHPQLHVPPKFSFPMAWGCWKGGSGAVMGTSCPAHVMPVLASTARPGVLAPKQGGQGVLAQKQSWQGVLVPMGF